MNAVVQCPQFHVYDDVLPEEQFRAVWTFIQLETLVAVHEGVYQRTWRLWDGVPLRSQAAVMYRDPAARGEAGAAERGTRPYPTHAAVDKVLDAILGAAERLAPLVGPRGEGYDRISACAYLYPQGTGLSWHADTPRLYSGSFVYFAHPEWNVQWGGELFVADAAGPPPELGAGTVVTLRREGEQLRPATIGVTAFLDNRQEDAQLGRVGMGRYIVPKPNRLVVVGGGQPHMINRVGPAAGDHVRCSIAGFFHRPQP